MLSDFHGIHPCRESRPGQINRLIPLVDEHLKRAGVPVVVTDRDTHEDYQLILEYYDLPDEFEFGSYERVIAAIEQGIGVHTDRKNEAAKERFYPHYWLGWLLGLPVIMLQRAGLMSEDAKSRLLVAYGWFVRFLVLLVLASLAGIPIEEFFLRLLDKILPAVRDATAHPG